MMPSHRTSMLVVECWTECQAQVEQQIDHAHLCAAEANSVAEQCREDRCSCGEHDAFSPKVPRKSAVAQAIGKTMTTPSGLRITDSKIGTGATPQPGQICVMHYTGCLYQQGARAKSSTARSTAVSHLKFPSPTREDNLPWLFVSERGRS